MFHYFCGISVHERKGKGNLYPGKGETKGVGAFQGRMRRLGVQVKALPSTWQTGFPVSYLTTIRDDRWLRNST
jgi:hypothetical protein